MLGEPREQPTSECQNHILKVERTREGMSVGQVPEQFGVSRRTVYKWLASFQAGGEAALENRSSTPLRSPLRLPVE